MKTAKEFLKDKNIPEKRDRQIIEGWLEEFAKVTIEDMMPNIEFLNKLKNQVYSKASKIYKRYGPGQDAYTMQKELIKMGLWVLDKIKSQLNKQP